MDDNYMSINIYSIRGYAPVISVSISVSCPEVLYPPQNVVQWKIYD